MRSPFTRNIQRFMRMPRYCCLREPAIATPSHTKTTPNVHPIPEDLTSKTLTLTTASNASVGVKFPCICSFKMTLLYETLFIVRIRRMILGRHTICLTKPHSVCEWFITYLADLRRASVTTPERGQRNGLILSLSKTTPNMRLQGTG